MHNPKTIFIHLLNGNPNGIKIIELSNRIIRTFEIPRILLNEVKGRDDINQAALYFLWDKVGNQVYIGESDHFYDRVKNHDQNKEFWDTAVVFIARDGSLDKGDVRYLESLAMTRASDAKRSLVVNKASRTINNLHEFKRSTIEEFFDDAALLLSTLGYPVFEKLTTSSSNNNVWFCKVRKTDARGVYDETGFTVLQGSRIDAAIRPSFTAFPVAIELRKKVFAESARSIDDDVYELTENVHFNSLNQASGFCVGGTVNGWTQWKNSEGKTLDAVLRKNL